MAQSERVLQTEHRIGPAHPVFQVFSIETAALFYEHLGFEIRQDAAASVYADRQGLSIQLLANADHDPLAAHAEIYVETQAVDQLHAEWRALDLIPVRTIVTPDMRAEIRRRWAIDDRVGLISDRIRQHPSGAREFSVNDLDNNQIRFGCSGPVPSDTPYR